MRTAIQVANWLDDRLHISELWKETAGHKIPADSASWFYVFGSATLLCFIIQILTGICLAFVYVPSTSDAFNSLQTLTHTDFFSWYLRAIHNWGSNFMVAIMTLHMIQVYLFGAYKYPRELTWVSGVVLLLCVLGMAFTGQVLRFDQDAYWGLAIGTEITGRVPLVGTFLSHLVLAGPIIGGETLSRFFTLHVFIIPGTILAAVSMHLRLVLSQGINEYPQPGHPVKKSTYRAYYENLIHKTGIPFAPDGIGKDLVFAAFVIVAILAAAAIFGPKGPTGAPDPTMIDANPRPDFYFLPIFASLALLPDWMETFVLLVVPVVGVAFLFLLPFLFNVGEKSYRRRPMAVLSVITIMLSLGVLAYEGERSPWSPKMEAWTADPIPVQYVKGRTPLEMRGAALLQNKQCRNCHALGGEGGLRGPALDDVATRLTSDQMVRQIIQGGGNMPAYGKKLSPAEVDAMVAFMHTLRHPGNYPAVDSDKPEKPQLSVIHR